MARLTFPSDRTAFRLLGSVFESAGSVVVTAYADLAATTLADVQNADGSANAAATFTIGADSLVPLFLGPASGASTLYLKVGTGTAQAVHAVGGDAADAAAAAALAFLPIPTVVVPAWAATTVYAKGATVTQGGLFWTSASAHTSGATFSGTVPGGNWVQGAPTSSGANASYVVLKEAPLSPYRYGAVWDGVTDDTAAIVATLAALPAYSGGVGRGQIRLPRGIGQVTSAITVPTGANIKGDGPHASILRGNFAGPILKTATDATSNPLTTYVDLKDMYVINQSASALARAVDFQQVSAVTHTGCHFQTAGGVAYYLIAGYVVDFNSCIFSGVGAERGLDMDGTKANNVVRVRASSFLDTKGGIRAVNGTALTVSDGCHFEALAGGASDRPGAISLDAWSGGELAGNYFESCSSSGVIVYNAAGVTQGFAIGENFMTNLGSAFIDASNLQYSTIRPNVMIAGAISPNANGLLVNAGTAQHLITSAQIYTGGGAGTTVSGTGTSAHIIDLKFSRTVSGSQASGAALASLLTQLATAGYIINTTTA